MGGFYFGGRVCKCNVNRNFLVTFLLIWDVQGCQKYGHMLLNAAFFSRNGCAVLCELGVVGCLLHLINSAYTRGPMHEEISQVYLCMRYNMCTLVVLTEKWRRA